MPSGNMCNVARRSRTAGRRFLAHVAAYHAREAGARQPRRLPDHAAAARTGIRAGNIRAACSRSRYQPPRPSSASSTTPIGGAPSGRKGAG